MLSIFSCVPLGVIFREMSVHVFCPFLIGLFVFWMLNCISSLYILDNNPLLDMSFVNIFSHSVVCLLVSLIISFTVQKLFIWM
uniref:Uncharacterized protein n=1 Tax=Ursus maritimus TaxID=29073 RepID=A0A452TP66_URSMA